MAKIPTDHLKAPPRRMKAGRSPLDMTPNGLTHKPRHDPDRPGGWIVECGNGELLKSDSHAAAMRDYRFSIKQNGGM